MHWARKNLDASTSLAVAAMDRLPFADSSVDTILSVHALEPNGGRESELLLELARVARSQLVLVEPHYEAGSSSQQRRMKRHGYVRGLACAAESIGMTIDACVPITNNANPNNAASAFVLRKPRTSPGPVEEARLSWSCPLTHERLVSALGGFVAWEAGIWYPIVDGLPILRPECAVVVAGIARERLEARTEESSRGSVAPRRMR